MGDLRWFLLQGTLRRFSLQSQRLLDESDSGTPPRTKKPTATGVFKEIKEKDFTRLSFNPRPAASASGGGKRESIVGDEAHEEGERLSEDVSVGAFKQQRSRNIVQRVRRSDVSPADN